MELLPPSKEDAISATTLHWWHSPKWKKAKPWVFTFTGVGCFGAVITFINQFFALRGVVNVTASRIYLALAVIAMFWISFVTSRFIQKHRNAACLLGCALIAGLAFWLDWWAPKPKPILPSASPTSPGNAKQEEIPSASEIAKEVSKVIPQKTIVIKKPNTNSASTTEGLEGRTRDTVQVEVIAIDLTYDGATKAFNFLNRGTANIYLWGDKLDGGNKVMDAPRTLTANGGSYHIWGDQVIPEIETKVKIFGELRIPFEVYVTTEQKDQYILHYQLWARIKDGTLSIETQNLGTTKEDFQ